MTLGYSYPRSHICFPAFQRFRENFRDFRDFGKLINGWKIPFCRPGITPLHSQVMQSRFPVRNNCRHDSRMIVFSPIFPKVRDFRDFRDFGKPNRCQKAQISLKWSLPPTHKFYMFNNTIRSDSVPIFITICPEPVLTFEKHRLHRDPTDKKLAMCPKHQRCSFFKFELRNFYSENT